MKQNLYLASLRLWRRVPERLRLALKALGLTRYFKRFGPQAGPERVWPLSGVLAGHRLQLRRPEDFQFVDHAYEPHVCQVIQRLVQPGWVCADVGAHIGYMTLLLAQQTGAGGQVFAFEAVPENAAVLRANVALNGYAGRVTVVNCAITDGLQTAVTLYSGPSSYEATIVPRGWEAQRTIPAASLDGVFQPDQRVDFIKMDIEGAEVGAVAGMRRLLAEARPIILIEIHDVGQAAVDGLMAAGYKFYDLALQPLAAEVARARAHHCVAAPAEWKG